MQVFKTAELMEMILLELDTVDLLTASQTNKAFPASAASSTKLYERLHISPDDDFGWSSFFQGRDGYKGVKCSLSRDGIETVDDGKARRELKVTVDIKRNKDTGLFTFSEFTPRESAMLTCQPPVKEMSATPRCCNPRVDMAVGVFPAQMPSLLVQSTSGITVDDVLNVAESLAKDHRICLHAMYYQYDENNEVYPETDFYGDVVLYADDPRIQPAVSRRSSEVRSIGNRTDHHDERLSRPLRPYSGRTESNNNYDEESKGDEDENNRKSGEGGSLPLNH